MTLDELIKELNEIKKKKGGDIRVLYNDDCCGNVLIDEIMLIEQVSGKFIVLIE